MRDSKKAVPQTNTSNGSFSKEDIVKLALKIIDEEGVDALSFRRLSKESGYPTMTICNRVSDRSSLLNDVVALMISEIDTKPMPERTV
ncbi:MAG: TetR/AcrR family transcriptional regulator [Actinobacteria bacterium]|nr:TetR/AcrR family transcriptional regulator [Actinomycetota bacterium]